MKLKIFSDLHCEFGSIHLIDELFNDDVDYYVIAGDLTNSKMIKNLLFEINKITNHPVIYVPGNHEYYHSQKQYIDNELKEFKNTNIIVLNDDVHIDNDFVFIGGTGWWSGGITSYHISAMNDFSLIYDIKFNDNGCKWGKKTKKFFQNSLRKYKDKRMICITHNMPSDRCVHIDYVGSPLNVCFAMNYDDLIEDYKPELWICGHTHDTINMMLFDTRILCNPYGYYPYQENKYFKNDLIFEL